MKRLILVLAVVLSFVSFSAPEQAQAACSGDITSFYYSGGYYKAAGWATCSAKLCVKTTGSYAICDVTSPYAAQKQAGVCLTNGGAVYASAYLVTSGGTTLDAASMRVC